jgi:sec-independent protein translocase protein TatC
LTEPGAQPVEEQPQPESELTRNLTSFFSHLDELRKRLIRAILALIGGMILCLFFAEKIVGFIISTSGKPDELHLSLLTPAEGFMVYLKVAFVAGVLISSPFWFTQLWGFISPGLYRNEKKVIFPAIVVSVLAFLIGAGFGFWILPYTAAYFRSFTVPNVEIMWSLTSYVDMALQFLLAFGLVFELPLIIYVAALIGVVKPAHLRKYRRHSIVGILIVAGFITPGPDVFSQVAVATPLIILYEVGILMAVYAAKRKAA